MKKAIIYPAFAMLLTGFASCSNDVSDNLSLPDGSPAKVSFTAQLPAGMATRAIESGNGKSCNQLYYAVFESNGGKLVDSGTDTGIFGSNLTTTHEFNLITGREYDFVFFASNSAAPYSIGADSKSVEIDYENMTANMETNDAFFNQVIKLKITGNMSEDVELKRPFAQLNIGTTQADLDASAAVGFTLDKTQVEVPVYSGFSLYDGALTGTPATQTFTLNAYSGISGDFPVSGYKYVGLNYLLVDRKELVTVKLTAATAGGDSQEFNYGNVPLQRNYRTNIYGNLLTSQVDYTIEINPVFDGEYEIWDGTTLTPVTPVTETIDGETKQVYHVSTGAQLAYMAQTPGLNTSYIVLDQDIDLGGNNWEPLGGANRKGTAMFEGTFDGKGFTVSNFVAKETGDDMCAALIGAAKNATIKNVTVKDAAVSAYDTAAGLVGYIGDNTTITDCDVTVTLETIYTNPGSKVIGQAYGGLIGRAYGQNVTISGCTTNGTIHANSEVNAQSKIGGIIGILGTNLSTGLVVENCTNNINFSGTSDFGMGGIIGSSPKNSDITVRGCTNNGDINNQYPGSSSNNILGNVGGIIGYMQTITGLTIENCTNNGNLVNNGGPIGAIYGKLINCENVTESGNTNTGSINGVSAQ